MVTAVDKSQITTAISRLPESSYGVARGTGDDFRRILNDTEGVTDLNTEFEDDRNYDNGSDMPDDYWATKVTASTPLSPDFCFQDIGFFWLDALGGYSVSGSGPYVHVFTPQDVDISRQLPSRTFLKRYGGLQQVLTPGNTVTSFSMNFGKSGRIKTAAQYDGSGYADENASGYTMPAIVEDREWGYNGQMFFRFNVAGAGNGTRQKETITAAGTASGAGTATATITAAGLTGSPVAVPFAVASGDTPTVWAATLRAALRKNLAVSNFMDVGGTGTSVHGEARVKAANDGTFNIAITAGGTGITAVPTSTHATSGVVGTYISYPCAIESGTLTINNPPKGDGIRSCSPYLIAGNPKSGAYASEKLVGQRSYEFSFVVRLATSDPMRDWLKMGVELELEIPVVGTDSLDASMRIFHSRVRVMEAKPIPDAGDGTIGLQGKVTLMAQSGAIPLSVTLINYVPSYTS